VLDEWHAARQEQLAAAGAVATGAEATSAEATSAEATSAEAASAEAASAAAELARRYEFGRRALPALTGDAPSEECGVCMAAPVDTLLLDCAHGICRSCSDRMVRASGSSVSSECPFCRTPVRSRVCVAPAPGDGAGLYGSRVAAALELVVRLVQLGESVLVFGQWRPLIIKVGVALEAAGVRAAPVEGTSARRAASVRRFEEGELRVLLLCFDRSFAGLHLARANHVVLLNPIVGVRDHEVAAMEEQAIGRAHRRGGGAITVHHLAADDTCEVELWHARRTPS
jgi:SNF2 family DNA or RNA helicase